MTKSQFRYSLGAGFILSTGRAPQKTSADNDGFPEQPMMKGLKIKSWNDIIGAKRYSFLCA